MIARQTHRPRGRELASEAPCKNIERQIRNSGVDGRVKGVKAKQTPQMVRNWKGWMSAGKRARPEGRRERGAAVTG